MSADTTITAVRQEELRQTGPAAELTFSDHATPFQPGFEVPISGLLHQDVPRGGTASDTVTIHTDEPGGAKRPVFGAAATDRGGNNPQSRPGRDVFFLSDSARAGARKPADEPREGAAERASVVHEAAEPGQSDTPVRSDAGDGKGPPGGDVPAAADFSGDPEREPKRDIDEQLQWVTEDDIRDYISHARPSSTAANGLVRSLFSGSNGTPVPTDGETSEAAVGRDGGLEYRTVQNTAQVGSEQHDADQPIGRRELSRASIVRALKDGSIHDIDGIGETSVELLEGLLRHRATLISIRKDVHEAEGQVAMVQSRMDGIAVADTQADNLRAVAISQMVIAQIRLGEETHAYQKAEAYGTALPVEERQRDHTQTFLRSMYPNEPRIDELTPGQQNALAQRLILEYQYVGRANELKNFRSESARMYLLGAEMSTLAHRNLRMEPPTDAFGVIARTLHSATEMGMKGSIEIEQGQLPYKELAKLIPDLEPDAFETARRERITAREEEKERGLREAAATVDAGSEYAGQTRFALRATLSEITAEQCPGGLSTTREVQGRPVTIDAYTLPQDLSYRRQPPSATFQERQQAGMAEGWGTIQVTFDEPRPTDLPWDRRASDELKAGTIDNYQYVVLKPREMRLTGDISDIAVILGTKGEEIDRLRQAPGQASIHTIEQLRDAVGSEVDLDKTVILARTHIGIGTVRRTEREVLGQQTSENAHHYQRLQALSDSLAHQEGVGDHTSSNTGENESSVRIRLEGEDKEQRREVLDSVHIRDIGGIASLFDALQHSHYRAFAGHTMVHDGEPGRYISQRLREGELQVDAIPAEIFQADITGYPGRVGNFHVALVDTPMDQNRLQALIAQNAIRDGSLTTVEVSADLISQDGIVEGSVKRGYTMYVLRHHADPALAHLSPDYPRDRTIAQPLRVLSYPVEPRTWLPVVQAAQQQRYFGEEVIFPK